MNLYIHKSVAKQFREAAKRFDGRLGLCATAALMQFLESDPVVQGEYINKVLQSELLGQVEEALQEIREEQARRVTAREAAMKVEKKK